MADFIASTTPFNAAVVFTLKTPPFTIPNSPSPLHEIGLRQEKHILPSLSVTKEAAASYPQSSPLKTPICCSRAR